MQTVMLFVFMVLFMLMRVYSPVGVKVGGKVQKMVYLSFQERSLLQRTNIYAIGGVALLMTAAGAVAGPAVVLIILFVTAILAMPVRVMLTTEGAAINRVVFRPWSDFTSFTVEPRRIVLNGTEGTRPLKLPVLVSHQQEIIPLLRRRFPEVKPTGKAGARRRAIAS
jgi:hypothetical protein